MKLTCEYQGEKMKYPIRLTLQNGEGFLVESGKGGIYKRHLNLTRVQHLPPALTDKGFISNHVRFLATDGASTAVVDIPCGDPSVVLVGLGRPSNEQAIPAQEIGTCSIQ
ncbi:MAG: hypothetical protein IT289_00200 [Oligoflexia bacterium]|nr:hypothetical protein [Oligoflexia bacterium]